MEVTMQAIDRMQAAYDAEWALWGVSAVLSSDDYVVYRDFNSGELVIDFPDKEMAEAACAKLRKQASMRAALRALADDPSRAMCIAARDASLNGAGFEGQLIAALYAAAAEGETPGEGK
jgi:hypothetical protein